VSSLHVTAGEKGIKHQAVAGPSIDLLKLG